MQTRTFKLRVIHIYYTGTSTRSPDSLKGNERRRVLLDTHARTLRIVSLEGSLCVKNLVDVHRHENTSEIHGTGSNSMNWHTLTLVLSPDRQKQEDTRLLHFSTPPADAGRWATSLSAIARHGQYLSTSNSKLPKKALESIDTNVLDRDQIKFSNETTKEGTNTAVDDETMIMHGFMYLLSSQEEWRRVHVTLTDTMLEWVLCAKHDDVSSSSTGIALYLENVRVGPTFLGTTGSCFTLSAANPSMVMTATNPLPLVVSCIRDLWCTKYQSYSQKSRSSTGTNVQIERYTVEYIAAQLFRNVRYFAEYQSSICDCSTSSSTSTKTSFFCCESCCCSTVSERYVSKQQQTSKISLRS